jgi:hypothetical protein
MPRGERRGAVCVRLRDEDDELVAAQATGHVAEPLRGLHRPRDELEDAVARRVAERVFDRLQIVAVEHDHRQLPGPRVELARAPPGSAPRTRGG